MKRIVILIVLVALPASLVWSFVFFEGAVAELRGLVSHNNASDVREEIRQTYELSPGARVELIGLNGPVKIETSDTKTAEVYIERTASTSGSTRSPQSHDRSGCEQFADSRRKR